MVQCSIRALKSELWRAEFFILKCSNGLLKKPINASSRQQGTISGTDCPLYTDNKIGKYPKGEGAGPYDFPIELNVKLIISCSHFAGCISFQWLLHYAPKPLSKKCEIRGLFKVENQTKSLQKSEFHNNKNFLHIYKIYIYFFHIDFSLPRINWLQIIFIWFTFSMLNCKNGLTIHRSELICLRDFLRFCFIQKSKWSLRK